MTFVTRSWALLVITLLVVIPLATPAIVSTEAQLRACIANAAESSCVVGASVSILMTMGPIAVTRNLVIRGSGNSIINLNQARLLDVPDTPGYNITIENIQLENGFHSNGGAIYLIVPGSTHSWTDVVVKDCGCDNMGCIANGQDATGTWKSVTIDGVTGNAPWGQIWFVQDSTWRFEDITIKDVVQTNTIYRDDSNLFYINRYTAVDAPLTFAGNITFSNTYAVATPSHYNSIFFIRPSLAGTPQNIYSDPAKPSNFVFQNTNRSNIFYVYNQAEAISNTTIQYCSISVTNAPLGSGASPTYVFRVSFDCGSTTISGGAIATSGYGILQAESPVSLDLGIVTADNTATDNTAKTISRYAIEARAPAIMTTKATNILNFMNPILNNFANTAIITWPSPSIAATTRPYALRLTATEGDVSIVNCGRRGIEMARSAFVLITASGLFNLTGCVTESSNAAGVDVSPGSTFSVSANQIVFQGNRVIGPDSTGGGAAASVGYLGKFNLVSSTSISFISNLANLESAGGGALLVRDGGSVSLSANSGVTFSGNQATLGIGGAVRLESTGVMTFPNKTSVSFISNVARSGSAISGTSEALTSLISQSTTVTATSNSDTDGTSCLFYLGDGECPTTTQSNGISGSGNTGYDIGTCNNMMPLCSFSNVPSVPQEISPNTPPVTSPIESPVEPVSSPVPEVVPAPVAEEEENKPPLSTANSVAIPILLLACLLLLLLSQIA